MGLPRAGAPSFQFTLQLPCFDEHVFGTADTMRSAERLLVDCD